MSTDHSSKEKLTREGDFKAIAQRECAVLLSIVRHSFSPSDSIEAMIILAFSQGAGWALGVDMEFEKHFSKAMTEVRNDEHP